MRPPDERSITPPGQGGSLAPLEHQEVRYKAAPTWVRALLWAMVGTVGFGFVFACIARIDEVVTATGELQALGAERPIKAPVPGVVSVISVREGQLVDEGQVLLQFDPDVNNKRLVSLKEQERLEQGRLKEQNQAFRAREESLAAKLTSLRATYSTEKEILSRVAPLAQKGGIQIVQYLQQKNRLQELQSEIAQAEANRREVQSEALKARQEILKELSNIERQLVETEKASEYESLRSPVKGRVFDLVPASRGYAAANGETLLKVVPEGSLEAKVFLTNADVGFVKPDMRAQIRVDAYPFTQFGDIPGVLRSVGEEVLPADPQNPQPRFPAMVALERQYLERNGKQYAVKPGQSVSVNLIVRDKPVISLLTDAVEKAWDALRGIKSERN
ncbi:MAG: HlyD family efflux transporter periplasmic adaptor subunit [Cyanobacteria bacterium M_surface_10_m1_298]|nr:HlyD family efflux transporter periplasmic adaptor subunit [Cyanobacteria bacterium M_surface_10_m1_298]